MPTNSGVEIRACQNKLIQIIQTKKSCYHTYPIFEGTVSELCEAIQNDNSEEGGVIRFMLSVIIVTIS